MIDELAVAAGSDPVAFRRSLLGKSPSASTPSNKGESDEGKRKHNGDVCEEDPDEGDEGDRACFFGVPAIIPPTPIFYLRPGP